PAPRVVRSGTAGALEHLGAGILMDHTVGKSAKEAQSLGRAMAGVPPVRRYKLLLCLAAFLAFAAVPLFAPGSFVLYLLSLSVIFAIIATGSISPTAISAWSISRLADRLPSAPIAARSPC